MLYWHQSHLDHSRYYQSFWDNQALQVNQATLVVEGGAEAEGVVAAVADGMGGVVLMAPMALPAGTLLRMETPEIREVMEEEAAVEEEEEEEEAEAVVTKYR